MGLCSYGILESSSICSRNLCEVFAVARHRAQKGLGREIFNWADYFLTTTENLRERYYEKFGIPKEKVLAFGYPRLDRLLKFLKKDKLEVAAEMGLKSDAINVLYAPTYNA